MIEFAVIAAVTREWGIGNKGGLPWTPITLDADVAVFKNFTMHLDSFQLNSDYNSNGEKKLNVVILGRKTWESIPPRYRPMNKRINIVISSTLAKEHAVTVDASTFPSVLFLPSLSSALEFCTAHKSELGMVFVIGGHYLYKEALQLPGCRKVFLTCVQNSECTMPCDTFFPLPELEAFTVKINITKEAIQFINKYEKKQFSWEETEKGDVILSQGIVYSFWEFRRLHS